MIKGIIGKGNKEFSIIIIFIHIFHTSIKNTKRRAARAVGRFMFLMESPRLNLGCHFDDQLYLILGAVQDDVNDSVDVGDVDFAITVHVTAGILATIQDDVYDGIHISNIHLKVAVHVAKRSFRD